MITAPVSVDFKTLTIPESIDAPDAADFLEMVRVRNLVLRQISGRDDHDFTADELLPFYRRDGYEIRHMWIVVQDGEVIGRVGVDVPLEEGSRSASWLIELRRETWGLGIGSTAHELVERTAREHGRTILQSWASHPEADGPRLEPPTGFGSIPDDHAARFYRRHSYTLEQVERFSALDVAGSTETIDRLLAEATAASQGYRVVQWFAPTPPEHVDGYAWMKSRMATDAPFADLDIDEEAWDAARIAAHDAQYTSSGRLIQVTAAEHIATGELCAFNELVIGKDRTGVTHQEDTLVLKEHRGHRLGMLVKCAGLVSWRDIAPQSPRVITYNAEENRPMLDINEAIGFAPVSYEGAWKKVLG
ncbi:GNAT family N-acetyltransferase [Microbacterium sp. BWT-B31]|uniref:GNAT family N-acetyltransferase n=1 Tax=Microbacterium sp. BWT-B31 TaxID=3232072 RepID=UPI003529C47D